MTPSAEVINAVFEIERKTYLELGVQGGGTLSSVHAKRKIGVDFAEYGYPIDFCMTTDEFFAGPARSLDLHFDAVYVDAKHDWDFVLRDFNNAVDRLNAGGVIFLHDLLPPTIAETSPNTCSDAYKILIALLDASQDILVQDSNYGLTAVYGARPLRVSQATQLATYDDLVARVKTVRRLSIEEMKDAVGRRR